VKYWITAARRRGGGKVAVVGLMFLLWLGTFALAASPQLHRLLHEDADSAGHHCLITQIQQQPLLAGFVPVAIPAAPVADAGVVCRADFQFLHSCDYRLSPSRAPPAVIPTTVAG
jgi:hypothetical protein